MSARPADPADELPRFDDVPDPARAYASRPPPPPPELPASPTREARRARGGLLLAMSALWVIGLVLRVGARGDLAAHAPELAGWVAAGALALALALRPGRLPATVRALQAGLALVAVAFVGLAVAFSAPNDGGGLRAAKCIGIATLAALGPLAFAALFFRRSFPTAPAWRGAMIGAVAGLAGAVGVHAHCPLAAMSHVLVAHGAPIVLGAALGALAAAFGGRA